MSRPLPKRPRIRLDAKAYRTLRGKILERDGWRCQACGSLRGLEVHHIERRSQSGNDSDGNLITLCSDCHKGIHTTASLRTGSHRGAGLGTSRP